MDPDPDPAIFVSDLQDVDKKIVFKFFFAYYFLKVHLHNFSKTKSHKEFLLFLLDDGRIRIRIHISDEWIRIREAQKHMDPTDPDSNPQHWLPTGQKFGRIT
jgi:hypothetical protein